jgi:HK97 family phage portal protein
MRLPRFLSRWRAMVGEDADPPEAAVATKAASFVTDLGAWLPLIRESFAGAWQRNVVVDRQTVLSFHAVYACATLIASDIAKLRVRLIERVGDIWVDTTNPAYDPVIRKPNPYQNRVQFWENWILSKLFRGNTYVLKSRDDRGVVNGLFVLDPARCVPLVAETGDVFYQLQPDRLSGLEQSVIVPASEIIHDRWNCLFHPLCGVSPIFANGLAATQGLNMQNQSAAFFMNRATPSGILSAEGPISPEQAALFKEQWDANYGGQNAGKTAVLGGGLKFQAISVTASDAQLIEQLKWTAEVVCSTFHVPPWKIGIGAMPTVNIFQPLNVEYYSQCLQVLIEAAEICLDEGLKLGADITVAFDIDGLLRMDTVTQSTVIKDQVGAGVLSPNEGRAKWDRPPVEGGEGPYLQQQNYSLAALAKRDAQADPFASKSPAPAAAPNPPVPPSVPAKDVEPEFNQSDIDLIAAAAEAEFAKAA